MMFGWIFVIFIVIWAFSRRPYMHGQSPFHMGMGSTALDVLNTRYINGEIDEETYIKMKNNILK